MKWGWIERISDFLSSLLLMVLALALIAAYGCLFAVFRPAGTEVRPVALDSKPSVEPGFQLSYQEPDS